MENIAEISALVKLLDDPDEEIYQHVEKKLLEYGGEVIHFLETPGNNHLMRFYRNGLKILFIKFSLTLLKKI